MVETHCFYGLHSFQLLPFASTCRSRAIRCPSDKSQLSRRFGMNNKTTGGLCVRIAEDEELMAATATPTTEAE